MTAEMVAGGGKKEIWSVIIVSTEKVSYPLFHLKNRVSDSQVRL